MLTTTDNPYNPFTQFDLWFQFDISKGYDTCAFIDRVANTSDELTDKENDKEIENAMKEIAKENVLGIYKLVEE
jgi:hypothetical protein